MLILPIIICGVLVFIDQLTKAAVIEKIKPLGSMEVIRSFFYLTYVENRGAAFGFFSGARLFFLVLTVVILTIGGIYYTQLKGDRYEYFKKTALIMIASGAIGNFIDRLIRGYVVDMLHFIFWGHEFAIFNFADILVVCGTALLAGAFTLESIRESTR